ncbi:hypothetical protein ACE6H2_020882 [Prunus campanulata]
MVGCLIKYSDANFFAIIDTNNGIYGNHPEFVDNPILFQTKVCQVLTGVTSNTFCALSYARMKQQISNNMTLLSTAECTRDLSDVDCKKCLNVAITELLDHSKGSN